MKRSTRFVTILALLTLSQPLYGEIVIRSPATQSNLIELYTSEGCSSCPPADRWLSGLRQHPALWEQIVPIAFHVDYWDYIGWKDRFAKPEFADRQRQYAIEDGLSTIYTPALISNGREWRNLAWSAPTIAGHADVGALVVQVAADELTIRYQPARELSVDSLPVNIALLGFGLTSSVRAGENAGRALTHDFVVLEHAQAMMDVDGGSYRVTTKRPQTGVDAERYALALWVSDENGRVPLQAAGGWLDR